MKKTPKAAPVKLGSDGRRLWKDIQGFHAWFVAEAPKLTNAELCKLVPEKWHQPISKASIEGMRSQWQARMTPETRYRASTDRVSALQPAAPTAEQSVERLDREILRATVRRLTVRQTLWEMVGQKVIAAQKELASLPPVRPPSPTVLKRDLHEEDMVLMISDVQAGLVLGAKESGGLGEFNSEILLGEIKFLSDSVAAIRRYHPNVRNLWILYNGDIVEGETIFPGQTREIDMNTMQQVMFVVEHFARFNWQMAHLFESVRCVGTIGNHGRVGKKGEQDVLSNFDYLAYKWIEERNRSAKNIIWTIPDTWWALNSIQGHNFLQVHGDDVGGGYAGIPFYGAARSKARYQDMMRVSDRMAGRRGQPTIIDYMAIGHFCLPDRARILTRDGFRSHDEVRIGEAVLGYDVVARQSAWTTVSAIHHYPSAPMVTLRSKSFAAQCTPEHRWVTRQQVFTANRLYEYQRFRATENLKSCDSLIVAAPAPGGDHRCSPRDAAILGWLVTDGSMRWQERPGRQRGPNFVIAQKKPSMVSVLRNLLQGEGRESVDVVRQMHAFYLPRPVAIRIQGHVGIVGPTTSADIKAAIPRLVCRLSSEARQAMLLAFLQAEGDGIADFSQQRGPILEAFLLLAALEGHRTGMIRPVPPYNGGHDVVRVDLLRRRTVTAAHLRVHPADPGPVWCPTTALGTWVAELDGQIFVTGNSEPAEFYDCIMNGSWPGGTSFSTKRLQRNAMPSQKLWAVHRRWGVTWRRDVGLRNLP